MTAVDEGARMKMASLFTSAKANSYCNKFVGVLRWSDGMAKGSSKPWRAFLELQCVIVLGVFGCMIGPALTGPVWADKTTTSIASSEDAAVMALVAEVDAAYSDAVVLSGTDKRRGLLKVKALIDRIVTHYPSSQASIAISLGKKVGNVDPMALDTELTLLGLNAAIATPENTTQINVPVVRPPTDPLLRQIDHCLTASNLPASPVGDARIKMRLQTGLDGAISGLPSLIEPNSPNGAEQQLFNHSLLALGACSELARIQRNSIVVFLVSTKGIVDGVVLQTDAIIPLSNLAPSPDSPLPDPKLHADRQLVTWTTSTRQSQDALQLGRADIVGIQARLTAMSYDPKGIDGVMGPGLRSAVRLWQTSAGIPSTGYFDGIQLDRFKAESEPAFEVWKLNEDHLRLLAKASVSPKVGGRRSHNGWYRSTDGNYCRKGMFGLWCQAWKPVAW